MASKPERNSKWKWSLGRLFGLKSEPTPASQYRKPRSLVVEQLEVRQLLTVVTLAPVRDAVEGNQAGQCCFTRDTTVGSLTAYYQPNAAGTAGYGDIANLSELTGAVTFPDGQSTVTLNVLGADDGVPESPESVILDLYYTGQYDLGSPSQATVWIYDAPTITVQKTQDATEGGQSGVLSFGRTNTLGSLTVYYAIDQTASTATAGNDYSAPATSGSVTFSAGASSVTLNVVPVDDSSLESDESVVLRIQSASTSGGSYFLGSPSSASCLIHDNEVAPTINVAATQNATEGGASGVLTFSRDLTSGSLMVYYSIDQTASTATAGTDYSAPATSGSVTFSAGASSVTLNVVPVDDSLVEGTESVVLKLSSNSSSYHLGSVSSASLSILDNDVAPMVSVAATQNTEEGSQSGVLTFSRDLTSGSLMVYYSIDQTASTATLGTDYTGPSSSGSVTFAAGAASVTLNVTPVQDTLVENDETVVLRLQSTSGSTYGLASASSATLLVFDDEPSAVTQLALLHDTGTSSADRITTDPTLTGQVSSLGASGQVTVQFDYDDNDTVDGWTTTDSQRNFTLSPTGLALGNEMIRARAKKWHDAQSTYVYGDWTSLSFMLVNSSNQPPVVSTLGLLHSSGQPGSLTTSDPTITGSVTDDISAGGLRIEFDVDNNGTVDQSAYANSSGNFSYTLQNVQPGEITVKVRAVEWDYQSSSQLNGNWNTLSFTLVENAGPTVNYLRLVADTGESTTDRVTIDPRITGQLTVPYGIIYGLTVQIDTNHDGTPEGTTVTDGQGNFSYAPQNVDPGEVTIKARGQNTDSQGNAVYGDWATLTFTLVETTTATVSNLHLVNDTGESSTDNVTGDPTLAGQVGFPAGQTVIPTTVQFEWTRDETPDATTLSDIDGDFRYTPGALPGGQVAVRARAAVWNADTASYLVGEWTSLTITYHRIDGKTLTFYMDQGYWGGSDHIFFDLPAGVN